MVTAQRPKPPDKQELCRKVTSLLKKVYHPSTPRHDLPVLESLLYAVCHEDTTPEAAEITYKRLMTTFPDLNEARVSSITELQAVFHDQEASAWRALRVKSTLQSTFDASYTFELERLKRKTVELAVKFRRCHGSRRGGRSRTRWGATFCRSTRECTPPCCGLGWWIMTATPSRRRNRCGRISARPTHRSFVS
ncbi:MAG: hypothetical protein NT069_31255 [Planctomycetota bacterium]|nr:hypothetical protein [Planctomycetota bacterium]